ncbi:histidine phosphatase family protein [Kitasatospora sp. NPDC059795]|uniref:histidine phosphatase family protein n=1 Tax=Kitasatospora sp. NPDC059795 TaxID=3346949 RepID=UPI0036593E55
MPTLLLVRHGRSTANSAGILAGWTPGVGLDDTGRAQAAALPGRLDGLPLVRLVSSPLERCRQTLEPLVAARPELGPPDLDERLGECHYGDWTGRPLSELAEEPLWRTVQDHASGAAFPGGESLRTLSHRTVDAVREWNGKISVEYGPDALWAVATHGDVIKAIVADALGLHLDHFQRISVEPCSVTAIRYTPNRPYLLRLGDTGALASLAPRPHGRSAGDDAVVGGETGTTA